MAIGGGANFSAVEALFVESLNLIAIEDNVMLVLWWRWVVVVVQSLNIEVNFEVQSFSKRASRPASKSQEQTFGRAKPRESVMSRAGILHLALP